jgi:1-acyl-sn-glycerol-3-phosphate acyltransferase
VEGIENIPKEGRALIVVNHSLATYDIGLLFTAIFDHNGRSTRPLADNVFFRSQTLSKFIAAIGGVQGRPDEAHRLLHDDELVAVAPGGMREGLRPRSQRYELRWERRKGFVRVAMQTRTPIILAMCPSADEIFDVYKNPVTPWIYQNLRLPFFLARGIGPTFFPKPVKLTHYIDAPIIPPAPEKDRHAFEEQVTKLHRQITERAQFLMGGRGLASGSRT